MIIRHTFSLTFLTVTLLMSGCFGKNITSEVVFVGDNCRGLPIGVREIAQEDLQRLTKQSHQKSGPGGQFRYFAISRGYKATPKHGLSVNNTGINGSALEIRVKFSEPDQGVMLPLEPTYPCLVLAIENQMLVNSAVENIIVFDERRREISRFELTSR